MGLVCVLLLLAKGGGGWIERVYFFLLLLPQNHPLHVTVLIRNPVIKRETERMRSKTKMRNEACVFGPEFGVMITE